jgi:hypothetical protein
MLIRLLVDAPYVSMGTYRDGYGAQCTRRDGACEGIQPPIS